LNPELQNRLARLRERIGPNPNPEFDRALAAAAIGRARKFVEGVKAYRRHPAHKAGASAPVIWQAGTTCLRDYNPSQPHAPVILVVPSLINRADILDLDTDHSFLRAMASRGLRPLLVDWDMPGEEERDFSLSDYIAKRLQLILDFAGSEKSLHLLGYCMGGNLSLALACCNPLRIRSLSLLATPWDFHQPDAGIGPQFLTLAAQMEPYLQALGLLPVDVIQSLFFTFQPTQGMAKFVEFANQDKAGVWARHFVLIEDWLNDGVPLAAQVARECLRDWYGENLPGRLMWRCSETIIDPRTLDMPAYVVVPGKDRIVPPESARGLAKLLPHATLHEPMAGHIGMIASEKAPHQVWQPWFGWLRQHLD
jgi:polyhydroxyalkanoate synthase